MAEAHVAKPIPRRSDPSRKSLHVLGVTDAEVAGKRWTVDRVTIVALPIRKLCIVARYVDPQTWNANAMAQQLHDGAWVAAQTQFHARVLDRIGRRIAVVPVRHFTTFESAGAFEEAAREQYQRWRRSLARLRGKQEWRLRIYHGPHAPPTLQSLPLPSAGAVRPLAIASAPRVADHLMRLWKSCGSLATAARSMDASGEAQRVFEGVFLLSESATWKFQEALARWASCAKVLGLTYYVEGPRPPFTFA